jgi:hypothetical protein
MNMMDRRVKVPVFFCREGKLYVAYSPILDLSSCGKTMQEAQKRFANAVNLFLDELEAMGTLDEVLTELGWHKQEHPRKEWIPPHILKHTQLEVRTPIHA